MNLQNFQSKILKDLVEENRSENDIILTGEKNLVLSKDELVKKILDNK